MNGEGQNIQNYKKVCIDQKMKVEHRDWQNEESERIFLPRFINSAYVDNVKLPFLQAENLHTLAISCDLNNTKKFFAPEVISAYFPTFFSQCFIYLFIFHLWRQSYQLS